jgi:hypothetical protein
MNDTTLLDTTDPTPGLPIALSSDGSVRCTECGRPASSASWRSRAGRLEVVARCTAHTESRRRELAGLVEIGVTRGTNRWNVNAASGPAGSRS